MEKVFTGSFISAAMSPTMIDESIPPLRNAPSGTSLTSRIRTASATSARRRSGASAGASSSVSAGGAQ